MFKYVLNSYIEYIVSDFFSLFFLDKIGCGYVTYS